ncbi:MAG: hypothetical protein EAZ74_05570, partial [Alphaproteobacteria bacterium]
DCSQSTHLWGALYSMNAFIPQVDESGSNQLLTQLTTRQRIDAGVHRLMADEVIGIFLAHASELTRNRLW